MTNHWPYSFLFEEHFLRVSPPHRLVSSSFPLSVLSAQIACSFAQHCWQLVLHTHAEFGLEAAMRMVADLMTVAETAKDNLAVDVAATFALQAKAAVLARTGEG